MKLNKFKSLKWQQLLLMVAVLLVLGLASGLRLYKLDQVPPAISWDEASVGYNAFAIANWGRDEYGKWLPWTFKSFGDDKSPVHVYFTALAVKIFGASDWSIRLAPAVMGILSVWVMYLLLGEMFSGVVGRRGSQLIGLIGALFLAISPYNIQFSRFNHEANFALFFFMMGLWLWLKAVQKDMFWLPWAVGSLGISVLSYHSSKVVVPLMMVLLAVLYLKQYWKAKVYTAIALLIVVGFGLLYLLQPDLLGTARLEQASIPLSVIEQQPTYLQTHNEAWTRAVLWGQRYGVYFSPKYLFETGDQIERHSDQKVGEFYKLDALFLVLGVVWLIWKRRKVSLILIIWALIGPLPGAIAGGITETGHAARALFTMGSWTAIASVGFYGLVSILPKRWLQGLVVVAVLVGYGWLTTQYLSDYYQNYSRRSAIEWQYGMKQIVDYVAAHPEYSVVYMTDIRSQPYAFFLFYLKYPLPDYLREVEYNPTNQRPHNNVYSFDKYHFGDWDQIQSMPQSYVLYIVEPSVYDGLAHKRDFEIKKLIKYPNGDDAFFLVAGNQ